MKMKKFKRILIVALLVLCFLFISGCSVLEPESTGTTEGSGFEIGEETQQQSIISSFFGSRSESLDIVMLLTILSLLPSILIMLTGFTRIIIVLSLVKNGMGLQQMPPSQVMVGLALFLTFFVMTPVIDDIKVNAYEPYIQEEIDQEEAFELAMKPIRNFMLEQTYKDDLTYFASVSQKDEAIEELDDISNSTLIPAFITSEIKRAFQIGFFIYIPFIVIDMIVASTLMSMGMMMLPPAIISMPFKLLLFVVVDGWMLTIKTLISSFT